MSSQVPMALVSAPCVPQNFTYLRDFQSRFLDNSASRIVSNNPVISGPRNYPNTPNQQWEFLPVSSTTYYIVNGNIPFLSSPKLSAQLEGSQAVMQMQTPVTFTVECVTNDTAIIRDAVFNLALTTWTKANGSNYNPVTYESYTGRPEQKWTFVAV
ncbi:hypothetical protein C8J57DRAFT_353176 [Mycena rebaudengoi]|nr:hypothetical protein C8J57DRAFT_353176 [Mycena rebaudengoi]